MKNILLIIDLQKGFVSKGLTDSAKERIDGLIRADLFDCVISTVYRNYPDSPIERLMGWNKLQTAEEQTVVGAAATDSKHFIDKTTYSAYSPALVDLLKSENGGELPNHVFIAGLDTECCVLATATDLFEAGIRPIVLQQYCGASGGEDAHLAGIRSLCSLIGSNNVYEGFIKEKKDLDQAITRAVENKHSSFDSLYKKAHRVVDLLMQKGWHISFAESCTGGKAAAGIVDVANASAVFDASYVTYANEAKMKFLGVSSETIEKYGVVSEAVAGEMASGAAKQTGAEVGIGISGIAGPSGATADKPIGMVCFGFYINGKTYTATKQFGTIGRNAVREASVAFVYESLNEKFL